nr:serine protease persephone-like isoform X3 [Danaus plexippus plexippus]
MYLKIIVYSNLFILALFSGEVDDKCKPNLEINDGTCKLITDCEVARSSIKSNRRHPFATCGYSGFNEIVCCPDEQKVMVVASIRKYPEKYPNIVKFADNFGDENNRSFVVADRACEEITKNRLPPLGLQIINGVEASLGEFPHMVALGYGGPDVYEFNCGASLLSELYALTAAHCVDTLNQIKPTIARMGVVELDEQTFNPNTDHRIADILIHPGYSRRTKYHDLSLVRLERPVQFDPFLSPICLHTRFQDPFESLTVTGWGTTSSSRLTRSTTLMKADVTVVSRSECNKSFINWPKLPRGIIDGQICAGDTRSDTCYGDSGGPMQYPNDYDGQYRLVGVTSFGRGCGTAMPGVYTRVAYYINWIENIVWPAGLNTWTS